MTDSYRRSLQLASHAFTAYFSVECVTKLCVYGQGDLTAGWRSYWIVTAVSVS